MLFCVLFSRSRGSSGRGREGDTEPDISQKEAIAMYGSDSAYWFNKISSCRLGGLLVSLGKTLAVVHKQPEIHGFTSRPIAKQQFLMWVKNPDMFEDARLLIPISHRDLASAAQESLATFPVYLPLGVFLAQNPPDPRKRPP
jgi:hypothetical protein